jgi:hypothetical protein
MNYLPMACELLNRKGKTEYQTNVHLFGLSFLFSVMFLNIPSIGSGLFVLRQQTTKPFYNGRIERGQTNHGKKESDTH